MHNITEIVESVKGCAKIKRFPILHSGLAFQTYQLSAILVVAKLNETETSCSNIRLYGCSWSNCLFVGVMGNGF